MSINPLKESVTPKPSIAVNSPRLPDGEESLLTRTASVASAVFSGVASFFSYRQEVVQNESEKKPTPKDRPEMQPLPTHQWNMSYFQVTDNGDITVFKEDKIQKQFGEDFVRLTSFRVSCGSKMEEIRFDAADASQSKDTKIQAAFNTLKMMIAGNEEVNGATRELPVYAKYVLSLAGQQLYDGIYRRLNEWSKFLTETTPEYRWAGRIVEQGMIDISVGPESVSISAPCIARIHNGVNDPRFLKGCILYVINKATPHQAVIEAELEPCNAAETTMYQEKYSPTNARL